MPKDETATTSTLSEFLHTCRYRPANIQINQSGLLDIDASKLRTEATLLFVYKRVYISHI